MSKSSVKKITLAIVCFMLCACVGFAFLSKANTAYAAESTAGSQTTRDGSDVKKIVGASDAEWKKSGNTAWPSEMHTVANAADPDGGAVVLHSELNDDGTFKTANEWARSFESNNPRSAAFAMNGFEMEFYMQTEGVNACRMIFTNKSGWYQSAEYAFALWLTKESATKGTIALYYRAGMTADNEVNVGVATARGVDLYFDYDCAQDYNAKTKSFPVTVAEGAGTKNTMKFATDEEGKFMLYVNGAAVLDMSVVQSQVLAHVQNGMYYSVWTQSLPNSGKSALRIEKMAELPLAAATSGIPSGYELIDDKNDIPMFGADKMGNMVFNTDENEDWTFGIKRKATFTGDNFKQSFFMRAQPEIKADFSIEIPFGEKNGISFDFATAGENEGNLDVFGKIDGEYVLLGSAEVPLYRDGTLNSISLQKDVKTFLYVNGVNVTLDYANVNKCYAELDDDKQVAANYTLRANGAASLYGLTAVGAPANNARLTEGYRTDNLRVSSDDSHIGAAIASDKPIRVRYTASKVSMNAFGAQIKFGDYEKDAKLRVMLTGSNGDYYNAETDPAIILELADTSDGSKLSLIVNDGEKENVIGEASVEFDGEFDNVHSISFGKTIAGYAMYFNGSSVKEFTDDSADVIANFGKITDGVMGEMQFACEGSAILFYPVACSNFAADNSGSDWLKGGLGDRMQVSESGSSTRVQFGGDNATGNSAVYNVPVKLDGFTMSFYAYTSDTLRSYVALGATNEWYQESELGIAFGITFVTATTANVRVYVTSQSATDDQLISVTVPFEWNNGLKNSLALRKEGDGWKAYCNGKLIEGDYSQDLGAVANKFTSNQAYVQLWGRSNTVMEVSDLFAGVATTNQNVAEIAEYVSGTVKADLRKIFITEKDLMYKVKSGDGYVDGYVWCGQSTQNNKVTVVAYDGLGGEWEYSFTLEAKDQTKKSGCGSAVTAYGLGAAFMLLIGAAAVTLLRARNKQQH